MPGQAEGFIYAPVTDGPNGSTIVRATLDGAAIDPTFIANAGDPCGVAVDGAHVYWANSQEGNSISRANLDGSSSNRQFITGANAPCGVAVDGTHAYWANSGTLFGPPTSIGRANIDGTSVEEDFIGGTNTPCGVAVTRTHVYWADRLGGTIGRATINGSNPDYDFITSAGNPCGVAVDDTHLYWANMTGGKIGRATLNGSQVERSFVTAPPDYALRQLSFPCGVAVDDAHVYWGSLQDIGRANLDGTGVTPLFIPIRGGGALCGVAVDSLLPPNDFVFGKPKRHKRKGTARLPVEVPGAGAVDLAGKRVKPKRGHARSPGVVSLPVKAKGKAKRKLKKNASAKVAAKVTFTPTGGAPNTEHKKIKLVKRR